MKRVLLLFLFFNFTIFIFSDFQEQKLGDEKLSKIDLLEELRSLGFDSSKINHPLAYYKK